MKDQEWSGLMKVPDYEVIKQLRIKLGKANSYISELEDKLKEYTGRKVKEETFISLEGRIKNLEKQLEKSRKECNKVVEHNIRLQKQLFKIEVK
jgi:predicted  nucleic acid-binding Zn-ribbon protein